MDKRPKLRRLKGAAYPLVYTKERLLNMWFTSFAASVCADCFVYPLDVTKTRLQIQGEHSNPLAKVGKYRGLFGTAMGVIREEGFLKLYGGFSAVVVRHFFIAGVKLCSYDYLRMKFSTVNAEGKHELSFMRGMVAGLISGAISTVGSNPLDLIKLQMQMESRRRLLGLPPRAINIIQSAKFIHSTGGIRSLWRGFTPNVIRVSLYSAGGIACYDISKQQMMKLLQSEDNLLIQFLGSMIAGFACSALSSPADVVKSRMMNQPIDEHGRGQRYKNSLICFQQLVRDEGVLAMYKGFVPYWLRCGPWFLVFWMSFEALQRLQGESSF
ncbi:mitochondrial uncoupling protein 4C-like [Scaptodrosophila lebanonensis]|uniref:Mitochondrial uncoupling protein 4C-like n=1 Tax=Drosophila lebanonensis TaxID=7225 RepID=A0A6J2U8G9_DROLE|nr:mitochondrial uncoupling protein 4C-like [Scaptodrosophila lebanonensis]